jgi:hypothetical protein
MFGLNRFTLWSDKSTRTTSKKKTVTTTSVPVTLSSSTVTETVSTSTSTFERRAISTSISERYSTYDAASYLVTSQPAIVTTELEVVTRTEVTTVTAYQSPTQPAFLVTKNAVPDTILPIVDEEREKYVTVNFSEKLPSEISASDGGVVEAAVVTEEIGHVEPIGSTIDSNSVADGKYSFKNFVQWNSTHEVHELDTPINDTLKLVVGKVYEPIIPATASIIINAIGVPPVSEPDPAPDSGSEAVTLLVTGDTVSDTVSQIHTVTTPSTIDNSTEEIPIQASVEPAIEFSYQIFSGVNTSNTTVPEVITFYSEITVLHGVIGEFFNPIVDWLG